MNSYPWPPEPTEAAEVAPTSTNARLEASVRRAMQTLNLLIKSHSALRQIVETAAETMATVQADIAALTAAMDGYVTEEELAAWTGSVNLAIAGDLETLSLNVWDDDEGAGIAAVGDVQIVSSTTNTIRSLTDAGSDGNLHVNAVEYLYVSTKDESEVDTDRVIVRGGADPQIAIQAAAGTVYIMGVNQSIVWNDEGAIYHDGTDFIINAGSSGLLGVIGTVEATGGFNASDGTPGDTADTGGLSFIDGLYVGGDVAAGIDDPETDGIWARDVTDGVPSWTEISALGILEPGTDGLWARRVDTGAGSWEEITVTGVPEPESDGLWGRRVDGATKEWELVAGLSDDAPDGNYYVRTLGSWVNAVAMLSTYWTGSTAITTLGTIATGVWNATAIADAKIASSASWNTAYTERRQWDGGSTNLNAATGRTSLGLGNVENTALSTWAGTANITTVGTIATGVWSGTAITAAKGGTGLTAYGTANQVLAMNTGGTALAYKTLQGTTNQVTVTHADGTVTLALPQSIATSSTVRFGAIGVGVAPGVGYSLDVTGSIRTPWGVFCESIRPYNGTDVDIYGAISFKSGYLILG